MITRLKMSVSFAAICIVAALCGLMSIACGGSNEVDNKSDVVDPPAQTEAKAELVFSAWYDANGDVEYYGVTGATEGKIDSVTVPSEHQGKPVSVISEYAFFKTDLTGEVILPSSVRYIRRGAFAGTQITAISLDGVTQIDDKAFENCTALNEVGFSENLSYIGDSAFKGCSSLEKIDLPESVRTISNYAFADTAVKSVILPQKSGVFLGVGAFMNCYKLESADLGGTDEIHAIAFAYCRALNSLRMNDGVVGIGYGAFFDCRALESIDLGGVKYIGDAAFNGCSSLKSVGLPDSVTRVGTLAFAACTALESIEISDLCIIYGDSFAYCKNVKNITAPAPLFDYIKNSGMKVVSVTVTSGDIPEGAFANNTSLEHVTLCDGVTTIGHSAFKGCAGLKGVSIPDSVTGIGACAFRGCSSLTEISLPNIDIIYNEVFYGCTSLESIVIPDSVKAVGGYAFYGCTSLKSIVIGKNVTEMESYMLAECTSLESVSVPFAGRRKDEYSPHFESLFGGVLYDGSSIPSTLKTVYVTNTDTVTMRAFEHCKSIENIYLPENLVKIENYAFQYCRSLNNVVMPVAPETMGGDVFAFTSKDLVIRIGSKTKPSSWSDKWKPNRTIAVWDCFNNNADENGYEVFVASNGLRYGINNGEATVYWQLGGVSGSVTVPQTVEYKGNEYTVTSIYDEAFNGLAVERVLLPSTIERVGEYVFYNCESLISIQFPNSLTELGAACFYGCTALNTVTLPASITKINDFMFCKCTKLIEIIYGGTKAQWNKADKGYNWNTSAASFHIRCSDGYI